MWGMQSNCRPYPLSRTWRSASAGQDGRFFPRFRMDLLRRVHVRSLRMIRLCSTYARGYTAVSFSNQAGDVRDGLRQAPKFGWRKSSSRSWVYRSL